MKNDYSKVLSEILLVLKNINDNICRLEEKVFDLSEKLDRLDISKQKTINHLVVLKNARATVQKCP